MDELLETIRKHGIMAAGPLDFSRSGINGLMDFFILVDTQKYVWGGKTSWLLN
jgi:hypothetical protein